MLTPSSLARAVLVTVCCSGIGLLPPPASAARAERLSLRPVTLDLPGLPSKVLARDVDQDGLPDLIVVVAFSEIEEIGEERVENLVRVSTVIPALFERREIHVWLATAEGGFEPIDLPLRLPASVLHLEGGPVDLPAVALTDEGLSRLELETEAGRTRPVLTPLFSARPVLAGTETFFAALEIVRDLDGDGRLDVLFPGEDGPAVYLGTAAGLSTEPISPSLPTAAWQRAAPGETRRYPWPEVDDLDADGNPDLTYWTDDETLGRRFHLLRGLGGGRFEGIRERPIDCHDQRSDLRLAEVEADLRPWPRDPVGVWDVDGDGRAEVVLQSSVDRPGKESMRQGLKEAKRPRSRYRFHRLRDDFAVEPQPYFEMEVEGHVADTGEEISLGKFADLDGDGREDLYTVTFDFSLLQVLRVMTTKTIKMGLDFHVWRQLEDGTFRAVSGLDLSEKLKIDLSELELVRFAQFAGDFDGDGRQDFVHLGRGKKVSIHRGQDGCRYASDADLVIELDEEPASINLVTIEDLDGDGRADLRFVRPLESDDPDVTAPARLEMYLSGGAGS